MKEALGFMSIGALSNKYKVVNSLFIVGMMGSLFYLATHPIKGDVTSWQNILTFLGLLTLLYFGAKRITELASEEDIRIQREMLKLQDANEEKKHIRTSIENGMKEMNAFISEVKKGNETVQRGEKIFFGEYVNIQVRIRGGNTLIDIYVNGTLKYTRKIP